MVPEDGKKLCRFLMIFRFQVGLRNRWVTWNMRYPRMKMRYGITPCPCPVSHKSLESLGSRRIIPRYVASTHMPIYPREFSDRLLCLPLLVYPRSGSHRMTLQAVDFFQRVLALQEDNGEVWSALGTFPHLAHHRYLRPLLPYSQATVI